MNTPKRPILSVVDYESWERGYMPPSEHILIDQLSYRGAKVNNMSDMGDFAFWLVTRGFTLTGEKSLKLHELMAEIMIEEIEKKKSEAKAAALQEEKP